MLIVVKVAHDKDAGVWFVESSDLPGLNAEADTHEELIAKIPAAVADLLEDHGGGGEWARVGEVPIEIIAHSSAKVRLGEPA